MFWDVASNFYDLFEKYYNGEVNRKLSEAVAAYLSPEDKVLECACGTGMITKVMAPHCKSIVATDYSAGMLSQAKKNCAGFKNVSVRKANINHLLCQNEFFDKVVAGNVIHLLDKPYDALRELLRVCKVGGKVIIPTYVNNENSGKPSIFVQGLVKFGADFKKQFDFTSYKKFFEDGGYSDVEYVLVEGKMPCAIAVITKKPREFGKNPIIRNIYTADPAPMVSGETLYLYTTHDEDELKNDFYTMYDWRCFSTKDMVHWKDHGKIFSLDDISWAEDRAWAPQAVERNGKCYLYCPVQKNGGGIAIAVGVADTPEGPFTDLGHPLVNEDDWNDIDPTVYIDDDGQAYLYFGNPELRYVLLNEDMVSYNETVGIQKIPMTVEAFGKGSHDTGTTYGEGPWFYKRGNLYYMVYAAFAEGAKDEHLAYSISPNPTGPWTYGGVLMTEEGGVFTNHPGIAEFKGHNYLFYHTGELPGGSLFHRSVCVAEFKYNEDGSIDTIPKCDGIWSV